MVAATLQIITNLKLLNNIVNRTLSQNCLLALLFTTENRKLKNAVKNLSTSHLYLTNQRQEITEKTYVMDSLEKVYSSNQQTPVEQQETIIRDLLAFATGDYKSKNILVKDALTVVQQRQASINNLERELFITPHKIYCTTIKEIESKIKDIKEFIWCGPTMQPVIIPYAFLENMYALQSCIEKDVKKENRCRQTYRDVEAFFSNKWSRDKKLFYVWFLTEPKKLITALQRLEEQLGKSNIRTAVLVEI